MDTRTPAPAAAAGHASTTHSILVSLGYPTSHRSNVHPVLAEQKDMAVVAVGVVILAVVLIVWKSRIPGTDIFRGTEPRRLHYFVLGAVVAAISNTLVDFISTLL